MPRTPSPGMAPSAAAKIGAKVAPPSTTVDVDVETMRRRPDGFVVVAIFVVEAHVSSGFVGYENEVFGGLFIVRSAHLSQRE